MPQHAPKTSLDAVSAGVEAANRDFGLRPDGKPKGEGWLGILRRPDGNISTEISVGVPINGKETDIPLLVPTLDANEVRTILALDPGAPDFFKKLPASVMQKAVAHATMRMAAGKSPFND